MGAFLEMVDKSKFERVAIPQGTYYLGPSDEKKSVGFVELKPHSSQEVHSRPAAIEELTQVEGRCSMIVFTPSGAKVFELKPGDRLTIDPRGSWHIHANPFGETSLTYWEATGDIRDVVEEIRSGAKLNAKK
jgi:oxalate decarboxylase/phosphoglucose isomerase-like protein (cupin superfamily)